MNVAPTEQCSDELSGAKVRLLDSRATALVAFAVVGAILLSSRLARLDQSLWHDEIVTAENVREGIGEVLFGAYIPNNHRLFSVLTWATTSVVGSSGELLLRLWSVVPFVAGVFVVSAWLYKRFGALTALLYAVLVTLSPLLLDLSRQARGYGLAFLAMSVLVVAALELRRERGGWAIPAFVGAGVAGTWTLPIFAVAFLATAAVLLADQVLRRRLFVPLVVSALAIVAWYAPNVADLGANAKQEFGAPIAPLGIAIAPIDQVVLPSLVIEGAPTPGVTTWWLVVIASVVFLLVVSPLLRDRRMCAVLVAGPVATLLVIWATRVYLLPRFVSYLLVPLFILLASGAAYVLSRPTTWRSAPAKVLAVTLPLAFAFQFVSVAPDVIQLPREANRDAARLIERESGPESVVLAYLYNPIDLDVYLGQPLRALERSEVVAAVCGADTQVVYVTRPVFVERIYVPCLTRPGTQHHRLEQFAVGGYIDVWFVPSARTD